MGGNLFIYSPNVVSSFSWINFISLPVFPGNEKVKEVRSVKSSALYSTYWNNEEIENTLLMGFRIHLWDTKTKRRAGAGHRQTTARPVLKWA